MMGWMAGAVAERLEKEESEEGGGDRAEGEPAGEAPAHRAPAGVDGGADRLHDQRGDQVAGEGGERGDAEEQDQDGGHEGAPAHAGEADRESDDQPCQRDIQVDVHSPTPPLPLPRLTLLRY